MDCLRNAPSIELGSTPPPGEIYPGDPVRLHWSVTAAGGSAWTAPVSLRRAGGRSESVPPVGARKLGPGRLSRLGETWVIETACAGSRLAVTPAPRPKIERISPSPWLCEPIQGREQCPDYVALYGEGFGTDDLPHRLVRLWQGGEAKLALDVRSWQDDRIVTAMPERPSPGTWRVEVLKGHSASRSESSESRTFEVRYASLAAAEPAPSPSPGKRPSGSDASEDGDACEEGADCTLQPRECGGRPGWQATGRIRCRDGRPVCVAEHGRDYCSSCDAGGCGGCVGHSCSERSPCAPGAICALYHTAADHSYRCLPLLTETTIPYTDPSIPDLTTVCTRISGFCWTPAELFLEGAETLACSESYR